MDDAVIRTSYLDLQNARPELFVNPSDGAIDILLDENEVRAAEAAAAARLREAGQPEEWARTGVVYEDQYFMIVRDAVRFRDGPIGTYIREMTLEPAVGSVVLPVLDGRVVLVRHFRHADRQWHIEVPRGFASPGATAVDNAHVELEEEIGAKAIRMVDLGLIHADAGASTDPVALFFAEIASYGDVEAAEGISGVSLVDPGEVARMIADGRITDGFTICAYTRAVLRGLLPGPGGAAAQQGEATAGA